MRKIEKILEISAIVLLLFMAIFMLFITQINLVLTGDSASEKYTYTKAICEGNVCQDYEISCQNNQLLYKQPMTGKVYYPLGWKDTRTQEDINKLC